MRAYPLSIKEPPLMRTDLSSFSGLNKLVSNTQLNPTELSDMVDCQLVEDGKIQCPRTGQSHYGSTSGSKVTGIAGFYKSDGTQKLLRMSGTHLQVYNAGAWDNVSGTTYTNDTNANFVTAYDKLYIGNGVDALSYYDGSSISTFSAISAPTIASVTRTGGSAGTYTFSYKVTAVTAVGETTPSTASLATANTDTLDTSTYMTITWGSVATAVGYNIYGRKDGAWYYMAYVEGGSSVTYADKGTASPQTYFPPPEGNTTAGPVGAYLALYKDTLFVFGDPNNPSRLYYSGGGDKINDFTLANGGGFIDISKNDGSVGTGMVPFKNTLVVFKEDSLYQFSFSTSGLPSITQINPAVGAIAPRSIISVENDIFFASRRGIFTVGNEPGFSFDVLRTNEISARVRPIYQSIDTNYLSKVSGIYATEDNVNICIFAYTPAGETSNSKALVFDRERSAWYEWTNIKANCWTNYIESDGSTSVLYGDDSSGYVKQVLTGVDDFGSAINGYFKTMAVSFGALNMYKSLKDVDIILRNPSGNMSVYVLTDGVTTEKSANVYTIRPAINWGHFTFKDFTFTDSQGSGVVNAQTANAIRTFKNLNIEGRSFLLSFDNNSASSFVLLSASLSAKPRSSRFRHSEDIVS
jgi:hypothetical protein